MSFKRLQRALFRTMAAVVALAILFCIGLYGYRTMFGYTYDSSLSDEDLAASVTADENITNIALFGLDTREGDKQSHSDCMMIVTVDNTRGKIKLISLMRDSLVDIDGYGEDKLNAAYFRGGPSLAIRTINENFGTDIKDYVAVDFEQLVQIVDAIGGVDIDVQNDNELKELNRVIKDYGAERGKEFCGVEKTGLLPQDGVVTPAYHPGNRRHGGADRVGKRRLCLPSNRPVRFRRLYVLFRGAHGCRSCAAAPGRESCPVCRNVHRGRGSTDVTVRFTDRHDNGVFTG